VSVAYQCVQYGLVHFVSVVFYFHVRWIDDDPQGEGDAHRVRAVSLPRKSGRPAGDLQAGQIVDLPLLDLFEGGFDVAFEPVDE
jgi:hypothetical protein